VALAWAVAGVLTGAALNYLSRWLARIEEIEFRQSLPEMLLMPALCALLFFLFALQLGLQPLLFIDSVYAALLVQVLAFDLKTRYILDLVMFPSWAIAFALAATGVSEIRIFDTDRAKTEQLAAQLKSHGEARPAGSVEDAMRGATGVVNGSPVGMLPNRGTPIPDVLLHKDVWVADAVYTPLWTPLLNAAKAKGAEVMTGRELAVYQAADAFELFTGLQPSAVEMGNAFDAVMARRYAKVNAA